jgi:alpha-glucosidase
VPRIGGVTQEWLAQDHRYDIAQPETMAIHHRWRRIADSYDAMLVGEVYILEPNRLATYVHDDGLHSAFWFGLVEADGQPSLVADMLRAASEASPHLSWVQSSHDRSRAVSRYSADFTSNYPEGQPGEGTPEGRRRALAIATLTMGLPGIPFLYYGEELGLPDGLIPAHEHQDPLAHVDNGSVSRDGARTPMPSEPSPALGFTTSDRAWLPSGNRSPSDTVAVQRRDPASHWHTTRRLLHTRRRLNKLRHDRLEWFDTADGLIAYRSGRIIVVANLSDNPMPLPFDASNWTCVFDTDQPPSSDSPTQLSAAHKLNAGQAVILSTTREC